MYVVKKKTVEEVDNILSYMVKRLNLEPVLAILKSILRFLWENIRNFKMIEDLNALLTVVLHRMELFSRYGLV